MKAYHKKIMAFIVCCLMGSACMDQYNPRPHWEKFKKERENAKVSNPKLNPDGTLKVDAAE